ncbi:TPA: tRNA (adenosine(37)-N6)-threonylcarbamoyltransferase complex ATPase subunit type 1 TsaE [Candidatus Dependentiae bacterium]|nr:tRNA (adenosine(37)-N6)-threonylcarbamoyltransferase complex ATPase subunit type 1 TsaE [Candidatus Dependentiae bacterium]HCU00623.1 tRNA (adenosine(37)-N6)-threonylcarbamoyltransferase complex ATPase subunit type 1 TsaE [Candidatus Dependentiae bacterium]
MCKMGQLALYKEPFILIIMIKVKKEFGLKDVPKVAQELLPYVKEARIVTFTGPLGAGKTTLIRSLAKELGIKDRITSPTFAYFVTYHMPDSKCVYHFDLYRLKSINEFYESGFDEHFYLPQCKVLIEWPEIVLSILPRETLDIKLDYVEDNPKKRIIIIDSK